MLEKKKRNLIFLEAAILTIIVYSMAIIVNGYLDNHRTEQLNYDLLNTSNSLYNLKVFQQYNQDFNNLNCSEKKKIIFNNLKNLNKLSIDIKNYGSLFLSKNENIIKLKEKQYIVEQLKIFNIVKGYNDKCKEEKIFPVFYFYNSENPSLDKQSLILRQFALNHKNETIILNFDINYKNETNIEVLKDKYNIINSPFIIFDNHSSVGLLNENNVVDLNAVTIEFLKFRGELND